MDQKTPSTLHDVKAFVERHEPAGRVWALGNARNYACWLFLRSVPLERNPSMFVARDYLAELIERRHKGSLDPERDIEEEAARRQLKRGRRS